MSDKNTYDAIVIGSGISGGWAAKEFTEKGFKTLLVEKGRDVQHIKDYPTANQFPWEFPHRGQLPLEVKKQYAAIGDHYALKEDQVHFFLKDEEQEYVADKPFSWIRGDQVGGRSLLWARHTQRWSDFDFEGPLRDGFAVDWPIRYKDLEPWYTYVEKFAGIAGNRDGLANLPDGHFLPPFEMTCAEKHLKTNVEQNYPGRNIISARIANLSTPTQVQLDQGRGQCQRRNLCGRGCPFGGYFSTNSATLPAALKTGNLSLLTDTIVHSLIFDEQKNKVTGIRTINRKTNQTNEYFANVFFVNASAIATNLLLLNSKSGRFPNGLGNDSGVLGKFVAFHNYRGHINASFNGLQDQTTSGRTPGSS
ncbi:MAG: GMC family oxidoreductase N-terminal domain-containing protein, partial [Segetibacter sp.]